MTKALVVFALKEEFAPWRRRHRFHPAMVSPHRVYAASIGPLEAYAAIVGAGAPDARLLDEFTKQVNPALGIVAGVAAGLKPQWRTGDLVAAQSVAGLDSEAGIDSDPRLVSVAIECGAKPCATLITLPRIVRTVKEKTRLAAQGDAADMESLPLLKSWSFPSLALRVVLDPVEMPMTCDFDQAMDAHGQVRIARIVAQLARQPQLLPDFLRLARQSRRCLAILAGFLDKLFERLATQSGPFTPSAEHPRRS